MKKTFKRAGVAVLSMAMLLSMGAVGGLTASAATNYTVATAGNLPASAKFKVYKICDNLGTLESGITLPAEASGSIAFYEGKGSEADEVKRLAAHLAGLTGGLSEVNTGGTALGANVSLDDGYYFVIVDPGTVDTMVQPMLVQVKDGATSAAAATAKVQDLTLTKTITKVGTDTSKAITASTNVSNTADSTAVAGVGDVVEYTIATAMPKYAPDAAISTLPYITDSPTHLTDNKSSIVVVAGSTTLVKDTDYTVADNAKGGFKITFKKSAVQTYGGDSVTVTYNATVLNTANQGTTANENTASIVYNNDYLTGSDSTHDGKHVDDKADVFTAPLTIHKTDGTNGLKNVSFTLKNSDGNYVQTDGTVIGNDATAKASATYSTGSGTYNDVVYNHLKDGTYTLTEETGPATNRTLAGTVQIVISAKTSTSTTLYDGTYGYTAKANNTSDSGYVTNNGTEETSSTITITNPPYNALPGTGGMGTTLFTVGGAVIVLMAGFMFVLYMRKRKTEE